MNYKSSIESNKWPGEKIAWYCLFNLGRSILAEAIMREKHPEIPNMSGGLIYLSQNTTGCLNSHSLVTDVLRTKGVPNIHRYFAKPVRSDKIDRETDVIVLTEETFLVPKTVIRNARSVVACEFIDPSETDGYSVMRSFPRRLYDMWDQLEAFIDSQLALIISEVHAGNYQDRILHGIIYPNGIPSHMKK